MRAVYSAALALASSAALAAEPGGLPSAPQAPAMQAAVPAPAAQPLGRLFFSRDERAALDESRRRPLAVAKPEPKDPLPPAPEYVMLNGVVRRSDGTTVIWLNERLIEGRRTSEGLEVTPSKRPAGVTVHVPQADRSVDLRVGQRLDVTSGKIRERYQLPAPPPPDAGTPPGAGQTSATPKPANRRPTRERELLRELLRDVEVPRAERPEPAAEGKG